MISSHFLLDPVANWLIRSARWYLIQDTAAETTVEIDYADASGDLLPSRVRIKGPGGQVQHCEFTNWTFAPTPPEEFNMAFYGLPDLTRARRPGNAPAYWLAGVAAAAGLIGLLLWRAARRRERV